MKDLIIHANTLGQLKQFIARPTHAVLLSGPTGTGKRAIADALVAEILGLERAKLAQYPYFLPVGGEGDSISIEAIRNLQKFLQLKTAGEQPFRRAVVIENAHALTIEAQNAFLKLLEEPPADTLLVLTADTPRSLLSTILSRMQAIAVHAPTQEQLEPLFANSGKDKTVQKQAYFLSGGMPGLLHALLYGEGHPLLRAVSQAKEVLQKPAFERLTLVDGLSKDKLSALALVDALDRISRAGLAGAGDKGDSGRIKQWHTVRKAALEARTALERSANAKLVLSNLFLTLN